MSKNKSFFVSINVGTKAQGVQNERDGNGMKESLLKLTDFIQAQKLALIVVT